MMQHIFIYCKWQQINGIVEIFLYPFRLVQKWVVEVIHTMRYPNSWQFHLDNDVLNHGSLRTPCLDKPINTFHCVINIFLS